MDFRLRPTSRRTILSGPREVHPQTFRRRKQKTFYRNALHAIRGGSTNMHRPSNGKNASEGRASINAEKIPNRNERKKARRTADI